jgi:predicted TPR repeat methyltransferase
MIVAADVFVYFGNLAPVLRAAAAAVRPNGLVSFTVERLDEADIAADAGFALHPNGRYSHSAGYLSTTAAAADFMIEAIDAVELRFEAGQPVSGYRVLLAKPAV